jgi:BLOC-1-related complex sub-unit 8
MYSDKNENLIVKYIANNLNEPSIGLCQIQQHIKQTTPNEFLYIKNLKKAYKSVISAIPDIENTIQEIQKIKKLETDFIPNFENCLEIATKLLEKK